MMRNDMKALVKAKPEPGLWLQDEPVPEIGPDEVLVKVAKTGICGTDIHIWNWDDWAKKTIPVPMIVGHEYSGEIVEVGASRARTEARPARVGRGPRHRHAEPRGARRALSPRSRRRAASASTSPAPSPNYVKIPAFNVVPLPDDVDDELGAILDPLGNAVHTALSFDLVGEDVLDHRRRADRHHGGGGRPPCRRAPRRHHRRQRLPAGARRRGRRRAAGQRRARRI